MLAQTVTVFPAKLGLETFACHCESDSIAALIGGLTGLSQIDGELNGLFSTQVSMRKVFETWQAVRVDKT